MKKLAVYAPALVLFFFFSYINLCLAQNSASEVERQQEMISQDQALRDKIESPEKMFIHTITIEGAKPLSKDEIKKIILPFLNKWLGKDDISQITDLVRHAYKKRKIKLTLSQVTAEPKDGILKIKINSVNNG